MEIVVEARTLHEVREVRALDGVTRILLDNMVSIDKTTNKVDTSVLQAAVDFIAGKVPTEASVSALGLMPIRT